MGNYYTADGLGGVGRYGYSTGTDCEGAMHAVTSATKPEAIGAQTAVHPGQPGVLSEIARGVIFLHKYFVYSYNYSIFAPRNVGLMHII